MKIRDLHESSYVETLNREIMNVIMMYHKAGVDQTDINNVIAELNKQDINVTEKDIIAFVDNNPNLSITKDKMIVLNADVPEDDYEDMAFVKSADQYNPAKDKAKKTALKSLKR